jgi:hypothetical protein
MKKILLLLISLNISVSLLSQELKCNVNVNSSKVQGVNKQVFDKLKNGITELMNSHKWTNLTFASNEKIDCTVGLIVNSVQDNIYMCEMQVQARRPVWNTNYNSTMLNLRDASVNFTFNEFDNLQVSNNYDYNLTAILAFYAYIIIGYDLDSFQKLGGTECFNIAEQIINQQQNRSSPEGDGWRAFDKNGKRYDLINNLLDEKFKRLREYFYDYHRLGLDNMSTNIDNARTKIVEGLPVLRETNRSIPQAAAVMAFIDAKGDELVNIFAKRAPQREKEAVSQIIGDISPAIAERFNQSQK